MTAMNKKALRAEIRRNRPDEITRQHQSQQLCRHIMEAALYRQARVIGGYIPLKHEADITSVLQDALQSRKMLVIPRCESAPHMTLRHLRSLSELTPGAYGIPEPPSDAEIVDPAEVDLLLVPLEGIDVRGYRLGKGGGYYDCLLAGKAITTMGCALAYQRVAEIPCDPWDVPLPACAMPEGIHFYDQAEYSKPERKYRYESRQEKTEN